MEEIFHILRNSFLFRIKFWPISNRVEEIVMWLFLTQGAATPWLYALVLVDQIHSWIKVSPDQHCLPQEAKDSWVSGGLGLSFVNSWILDNLLFLHCEVTKYHKPSSLKQHRLMSLQFRRAAGGSPRTVDLDSLLKSRWRRGPQCSSRAQGSLPSSLVVGRIHSLLAVRWRFPFPWWSQ